MGSQGSDSMQVNGFTLPSLMANDIHNGRTTLSASERERLRAQLPFAQSQDPDPYMCDVASMERENRIWSDPQVSDFVGEASEVHFPGSVDPTKTLIIGIAGTDMPIALDYRFEPPRVIYLAWFGDTAHWCALAPTYEILMYRIRDAQGPAN
jgi:hypothetical protein